MKTELKMAFVNERCCLHEKPIEFNKEYIPVVYNGTANYSWTAEDGVSYGLLRIRRICVMSLCLREAEALLDRLPGVVRH